MEALFARLLDKHVPKLNHHVMAGLACLYMPKTEEYLDKVFRSAARSFPEGLRYEGYEPCSPYEEFEEVTKVRTNKRVFDLARSDLYYVKYNFSFNGIKLRSRYIYLPFVNDGGVMSLGGSKYHITPVLSDKVISPESDSIFVRLLRDKITFRRCLHTLVIDGIRETTHVVWSPIYRKSKDKKKVPATTKANTSVAHYLFAKYGFVETFRRFAGFVPIVGEEEITTDLYPKDQWVICETSGVKPKTFLGELYMPTKIRLAIPRANWNSMTKALVVGFYYVVDHFPARFKPGYLDESSVGKTSLWMILLGCIIFSGLYGENKLYADVKEHFASLDDYLDTIIIDKLKESGYEVNDFYDLLALILDHFNAMVLESGDSANSMFGKSLEVLYYVLYDITSSIFKVNFRLSKQASKRKLTPDDINEIFNRNLRPGAIFGLSSGKIVSESVSYSGDHMYPKITSRITEQESLPGATRGSRKRLTVGPEKHLDVSMIEAGSILFLSKSNPTPKHHINPYVKIDLSTGTIVPKPEFEALRKLTNDLIKGYQHQY